MRETEPELLGAGNGRQAPITIKVAFLGSMLGPSALFNTGYRQGLHPIPVRPVKEPLSIPVLRLTYCFAVLVNFSSTWIYHTRIHTNSRFYGGLSTWLYTKYKNWLRVRRNSIFIYAKKKCYDSLKCGACEASEKNKCDCGSDRHGANLHDGPKSQHRDSAAYISNAVVHKGKQKGVRKTARLVAILGGVNSGCEVRFMHFMRRLV